MKKKKWKKEEMKNRRTKKWIKEKEKNKTKKVQKTTLIPCQGIVA